jgi:hypothetical protein
MGFSNRVLYTIVEYGKMLTEACLGAQGESTVNKIEMNINDRAPSAKIQLRKHVSRAKQCSKLSDYAYAHYAY